jgi:hypothetical protein
MSNNTLLADYQSILEEYNLIKEQKDKLRDEILNLPLTYVEDGKKAKVTLERGHINYKKLYDEFLKDREDINIDDYRYLSFNKLVVVDVEKSKKYAQKQIKKYYAKKKKDNI